jgi:signal transduction histidine kinase
MILRSVTSRLVFFYCLLLVLLGAGFLAFTVFSFRYYARESLNSTLGTRAQEIRQVSEGLLEQPARLRQIIERRFSPESEGRFIRISAQGRTLYLSPIPINRVFDPKSVPVLPMPPAGTRSLRTWEGLALVSREFPNDRYGSIRIDTGQSYQFAETVEHKLATSLFVALPVLLLAAALAGYFLMRRALTPVETMINAAETYSFNDPHKRLPAIGAEPRIEALGQALNRMLDRLDNAYSHVSRFSADAAHELRTPLTIVRGELELVASGEKNPEDIDRAISNALEEMTRLSALVDNLITLSRMESMWGKRAHAAIDLEALARETMDQMSLLAVEKQIALSRPDGPTVLVAGDRERLKQVLVNLLDNAIKYTPKGGEVSVRVGVEGENGFFTVEDTGIGIDPDHQERVFDRFYRISPDRGEIGAGLGLAIVKSICHAHGGAVTLRSVPKFGSCFKVEIPLFSADKKMAAAEPAAANVRGA